MWKSFLIKPYARLIANQVSRERKSAIADQSAIFNQLIKTAQSTVFGKDHDFNSIKEFRDFQNNVPIRDYEQGKNYYEAILNGDSNVLWSGQPKYLAKTSGTTSGTKYIPITAQSMPHHIKSARRALMNYAAVGDRSKIFDGKVMFLSGSPKLEDIHGMKVGRLSGMVNHEIPNWLKANQLPSYDINCIDEWERKVDAIVENTSTQDLRLISGIPPWVQMYFERMLAYTGKSNLMEVFPNLQLFMYGGVNYAPYRATLEALIGKSIDSIETYPASEGFIAYQDTIGCAELLLNTNAGIFYEFVPLSSIQESAPTRLTLSEVEVGKDYAIILSNDAGLWAYNLGDTVQFTSLNPYRIVVSGRVKHFISAFGEHVIAKEVEESFLHASEFHEVKVREFTVAPQVNPHDSDKPYHEWFVEFEQEPKDLDAFSLELDQQLRKQNSYYDDLVDGRILRPLVIRRLKPDAFREYMKRKGKLGGQNKVPRLSNDRKIADELIDFVV